MRLLGRRLVAPQLERRERTNRDVVSVRIPERERLCSSIRVRERLLFEPGDERACPFQYHIEIVDAEEQEEPVARCRVVPGSSTTDARARPTGGGRAGQFHPNRGSDQSRHGRVVSRAGRRVTGTI